CSDLIALGERLKANAKAASATSRPSVPEPTRTLPAAEKSILLRSSRLHGSIFPPWDSAPDPSTLLDRRPDSDTYVDPFPFSLSEEQRASFAGWRRPAQIFPPFMSATGDIDLVQDLATDCSVVASLCAAARHLGPTKDSLLASLVYPFNHEAMRPEVSKNGKYVFRLHFNGCWRQVVIDDRLPKAYLKIRGGYDFPGSNSATDLYAFTGWIPEQIFLQSDDIELDEMWDRIKAAYDDANAILTLGTGKLSPEEEEAIGLVREHDYAILDVKREASNRLFLVKNPWCDSLVWTGVGSSATLSVHSAGSPPHGTTTNMFWMPFEDVFQHFDSLYMNWNPAVCPGKTEELVFTHNPQYSLLSHSDSPVWVLLSRHWQDGELNIMRLQKMERDADHDDSLASVSKQLGFMSLALFATTPPGSRIPLADGHRCLYQGPFVDSPNTLMRLTPTPGTAQTVVVAQSELPLPIYSFTISFFSKSPLVVSPAAEALPHQIAVPGAWTWRTAGGSAAHASYLSNPQFALELIRATPLTLVLSTDVRDLPVHVALLYSGGGQRVTTVAGRDLLGSSVEYSRGRTFASIASVDAGTYTVVASTFEPGQTGKFSLRICAAVPISLKPVLADAAGRLRTPTPSPAVFGDGEQRLRARINVIRLTRASVLARASIAPSSSAIRVALELGTGPHRIVLAVSNDGEFADASLGLRTAEADLDPGADRFRNAGRGLWLVVEQIGGSSANASTSSSTSSLQRSSRQQGVHVEVLSDGVVHLGAWENVEADDY
ncbi:hypothetical protein B0H63DRAFT_490759, partial [Podospora didyma]